MAQTAVLLIDMQQWFWRRCHPFEKDGALSRQLVLLRHCAEQDIPVVNVECEHEYVGSLLPELTTALQDTDTYRHRKVTPSAFAPPRGDGIVTQLKRWGAERLLLAGIYADYCVLDTARDAARLGYQLAFDHTLYASCSENWRDVALPAYAALGAVDVFENLL